MNEEPNRPATRGGDPLGAMYFLAAVLMGVAFLAIVVLTFLPRDFFSRPDSENLFVPAAPAVKAETAPDSAAASESAAAAREAEDMHMH
jgi:hypothetical protein